MQHVNGRGAQINPPDPFSQIYREQMEPDPEDISEGKYRASQFIEVFPKTIVNKVKSPDVGMDYSINAYQGCEHGCAYCYARNTHPYWGYSAGLDFESKIMVKKNAADLLHRFLSNPKWQASPIVMSGNTDCYQPAESKFKITRSLLKVFADFRHPTGIITKNALILRDLDVLTQLNRDRLVHVVISITTLDDELRSKLEPRTSTIKKRLQAIAILAKEGIPVSVMVAPIIPGINEHEVMEIVRIASLMGASKAGFTIVRLNGDVETVFSDWLERSLPDRKEKVLNKIASCHGGKVGDSRFNTRMKGEGKIAQVIRDQFKLAVNKYMPGDTRPALNTDLYERYRNPQMLLDF
ncbi:MAG: PA0069 family radical SAM protein [Saprospiraceae bacterium]|nr:PA0069 family radical SAM protein [Saprospiraceae bacterium]